MGDVLWWGFIGIVFFGGAIAAVFQWCGEAVLAAFEWLCGRKKAKLRAALKAKQAELEAVTAERDRYLTALTSGTNGSNPDAAKIAELAEQTRTALDDRSELMDIVSRVQSQDLAYPQLPKALADDIAGVLGRYRSRLALREDRTPVTVPKRKEERK